jgi:DNA processing protein
VLRAAPGTLRALAGDAVLQAIGRPPPAFDARWAALQRWLAGGDDRHAVTLGDAAYPARLLQTADPPLLLYVHGDPRALAAASLAIVGSRHPTPQGQDNAGAFAEALSGEGLAIVSGLALGIDAAAHEGALKGPAGTLAVLGTGIDEAYPRRHRALADRVAAHGALVSEFAPGTPALREHFPQRNRIIAGLSLGTLVVEAALPSGSLITARLAAEAGREVFAIPGSIHSPQSKGCHALLKQGAKLVESAQDILEELRGTRSWVAASKGKPPEAASDGRPLSTASGDGPRADPLLDAIGHDPVTLDALIARTGWPTAELSARLLELELTGQVARLPGGLFQRLARG